ncbi:MAG TPA: PDZ domain-containing protein [Gemmatimonadaceae bacterium]|nr:PDZ domain-containing protein [Gemmatimonadaceae bacterium]
MPRLHRLAGLRFGLPILTLVAGAVSVRAQATTATASTTRMLRSPTVSATQIAFAYAGNIWVVPRAGGSAVRLTSVPGDAMNPYFSPDGKWIAFSGNYGGNTDVYVMPAEGGEPKRLTWHPAPDLVQGWTPDGKAIVFSSTQSANLPTPVPRWFTVSPEGGLVTMMPAYRAYQGKISPDGRHIAYRMTNSWDEERRDYRGGQNRPIWILDTKTLDVVDTIPRPNSKEMDPVWVGNSTVYFLSDRDGVSNVWSYDMTSKQVKQITTFSDFDVKTLDAGPDALVFEQGGYVHELDPASGKEHIVPITAVGDFAWMMPQWKEVSRYIDNIALSPTGKRAAIEARGEIFTVPAEKGDVRNLTQSSASAERDPAWSPDGKWVSYFSDKSGEYQLVIASADGSSPARTIALEHPTHYYTPSWAPDGKHIVFQDTNLRLWVVDVATGKATDIGGDEWMVPERSLNPTWSPDSRWIAYVRRLKSLYRAIFVYDMQTGQTHQITDGLADATWPAWDASGKYLWFFASTDLALGSGWLDMSSYGHTETKALYLAVLSKNDPSPLLPESDEDTGVPQEQTPGQPPLPPRQRPARTDTTTDTTMAKRIPPDSLTAMLAPRRHVEIDFEGLLQRVVPVSEIAERDYGDLHSGVPGTVFFTENLPETGTNEQRFSGGTVHRYDLKERKAMPFVQNVAEYFVSEDGKKLLYRTPGPEGSLFLVDATTHDAPPKDKGKLNAQLRMLVDPSAEFKQIFDEGWRNQRDYIYVKNLQGTDWVKDKQMYSQLLPYVKHRDDLNYLLDEMGAEIAIGHSFVRGGDMPGEMQPPVGLLGADFEVANGRYKITKIYGTDSWNPDLHAPLTAPGVKVQVGDYVLAVNGQELRAPDNVYRLFDGTANHQTTITVNARPTMDGARRVTVIPVASDAGLRARAWVEHNRHIVDSLSHGELAYVHLPNTAQGGYNSFNRYYFAQQDRKGAIIDERYNGGGSAADYIIDVLQRTFDGYFNNPVGERYPFTSPAAGIWGPKVMIINEMSGSGGDLMPYMFKYRKVGQLVGMRTWGGLVGIWDTPPFVDGGIMFAPRGGFFAVDDKWAVENEGISPNIEVEDWPKDVAAGHDAQLERAVAEAMQELTQHPVVRATHEPPSPMWGKRVKPIAP